MAGTHCIPLCMPSCVMRRACHACRQMAEHASDSSDTDEFIRSVRRSSSAANALDDDFSDNEDDGDDSLGSDLDDIVLSDHDNVLSGVGDTAYSLADFTDYALPGDVASAGRSTGAYGDATSADSISGGGGVVAGADAGVHDVTSATGSFLDGDASRGVDRSLLAYTLGEWWTVFSCSLTYALCCRLRLLTRMTWPLP